MSNQILEKISQETLSTDVPEFRVGDVLKVNVKIKEGDKQRLQAFAGTVIARDGEGGTETFTLRRVSHGEGVERVFPVNSPNLDSIEV